MKLRLANVQLLSIIWKIFWQKRTLAPDNLANTCLFLAA